MCVAVICFSLGSTVAKKAGLPGPTLAFWRMLGTSSVWWLILWITERRIVSRVDVDGRLLRRGGLGSEHGSG